MNIYGYCRISTAKQSIDRQIRNIKAEYPTAHIVQEAYTGTSIFRPEWLKIYRILKAGDTVVFDSVSRMSRNAEEGFALYEDLYHKGIRLVFLKEHHIDTETYKKALSGSIAMTGTNVDFILKGINEYLMALAKEQIKLAFEQSEKEVADLHQRTREGLLTARLNGKQVGRKKGVGFETKKAREAKQIIRTHCKTFGGTLDDAECILSNRRLQIDYIIKSTRSQQGWWHIPCIVSSSNHKKICILCIINTGLQTSPFRRIGRIRFYIKVQIF